MNNSSGRLSREPFKKFTGEWKCALIRPGINNCPVPSMIRASGRAIAPASCPTALIRFPSIKTSAAGNTERVRVHGKNLRAFDEYLHFHNRYPVRHRSDRTRTVAAAVPHAYPAAEAFLRRSADGRKTLPPRMPKPVPFITTTNFADGHANPDTPRRSCAVRNKSNSRAKPVLAVILPTG